MTKLTIKIDENISLTGTIVSEEGDGYEFSGYDSGMEVITGNCSMYSGNIKLPMPGMELNPPYRVQRDFNLIGNLTVDGNSTTTGTIRGVGSTATVQQLSVVPASNKFPGKPGELAMTGSHMHLCVDTDTWVRWSINTSW